MVVTGGIADGRPRRRRARLIPARRPVPSDSVLPSTPVNWPAKKSRSSSFAVSAGPREAGLFT